MATGSLTPPDSQVQAPSSSTAQPILPSRPTAPNGLALCSSWSSWLPRWSSRPPEDAHGPTDESDEDLDGFVCLGSPLEMCYDAASDITLDKQHDSDDRDSDVSGSDEESEDDLPSPVDNTMPHPDLFLRLDKRTLDREQQIRRYAQRVRCDILRDARLDRVDSCIVRSRLKDAYQEVQRQIVAMREETAKDFEEMNRREAERENAVMRD